MAGVFDDEEPEPAEEPRDREFTLGSGALLAIFLGLVLLCGLCFALGYSVGHRGAKTAAMAAATTPGEQEPLQGSGTVPKPSAIAQGVVVPPPTPAEANEQAAASTAAAPVMAKQEPGQNVPATAQTAVPQFQQAPAQQTPVQQSPAQQSPVRSALTPGGSTPETQETATTVRPAFAPSGTIMVQIAAVANPQDADVLMNALRKRNYPVTSHHDPADNLIHVRVGPFATKNEASQWQMRLLNDGYNAIVQP